RITIIVILIIIIIMYFQFARNELDLEIIKLTTVYDFLQNNPEHQKTENTQEIQRIKEQIRWEQHYGKRWWSLSIGYRLDWIKMYQYYRPPFYRSYKKWKEKKGNNLSKYFN